MGKRAEAGMHAGRGNFIGVLLLGLVVLQSAMMPLLTSGARAADMVWDRDTTVSGDETYENTSILLQGNLYITGSLTLSGVDLCIESAANGAILILVDDGGSLSVLAQSTVHSSDPEIHYMFQVRSQASLTMNDSELRDCGWEDWDNYVASTRGLYIESSNAWITNSTLTENYVGVIVDGGCSPYIGQNDISGNDGIGVAVLGGSSPTVCDNAICRNLVNNPVYDGAGLYSDSSSPTVDNNTVSDNVDNAWGNAVGIVANAGTPVITRNNVSGHRDPSGWGGGWGIAIYSSDATVSWNDVHENDNGIDMLGGTCLLENNLVGATDESGGIGIYENGASVSRNNTYHDNICGAMLGEGSTASFDNDTFDGNDRGVDGYSFSQQFSNTLTDCIFVNNTQDVAFTSPWHFSSGGTATLVRPQYDPAKVKVSDPNAVLIVKWDLVVRVVFESDGRPASGAEVVLVDSYGKELSPLETDEEGWTELMLLEEYRHTGQVKQARSPYGITATHGSFVNSTVKLKLDACKNLTVVLDDMPPDLTVLSPANGTITNRSVIELTGDCEPGASLRVDGRLVPTEEDGRWSALVELAAEGANDIIAEAKDHMQNAARLSLRVFRDTVLPAVQVSSPADRFLVNTTTVTVNGKMSEPDAILTINGVEVEPDAGGQFSHVLDLTEGKNTIRIVCTDAAKNIAKLELGGTMDTLPPFVRVLEPSDGFATNASMVSVSGLVESGAALTMNGRAFPVADTAFGGWLELAEGENMFVFSARDRAGNVNTTSLRIVRDSTPPVVKVSSPAEGARSNRTIVEVCGTTEPASAVKVNGRTAAITGGEFHAEVALKEGENAVLVESEDALGNIGRRSIIVIVDTAPPELKILGPANRSLINTTAIEVNGLTEPGAVVTVGGQEKVAGSQGRFSATVMLDREGENIISVSVRDALFNTAWLNISVLRDTVAQLELSSPANGSRVKASSVAVMGKAEPNSTVRIAGTEVRPSSNGSFSLLVPVVKGSNIIIVEVRDMAGNTRSAELVVTQVKEPAVQQGNDGMMLVAGAVLVLACAASAAAALSLRRR